METNRESGWGNAHWPILTRISTTLLVFIFVGLRLLYGQEPTANNTPASIATDRPSVTNSSIVVPVGSLQAENGFLVTNNQGQDIADGAETLVRFGVRRGSTTVPVGRARPRGPHPFLL